MKREPPSETEPRSRPCQRRLGIGKAKRTGNQFWPVAWNGVAATSDEDDFASIQTTGHRSSRSHGNRGTQALVPQPSSRSTVCSHQSAALRAGIKVARQLSLKTKRLI